MSLDADKCRVKAMLYTTNSSGVEGYVLTELARQLGWEVFEAPKLSKHGVPFVKNLYTDAAERVPNCVCLLYTSDAADE